MITNLSVAVSQIYSSLISIYRSSKDPLIHLSFFFYWLVYRFVILSVYFYLTIYLSTGRSNKLSISFYISPLFTTYDSWLYLQYIGGKKLKGFGLTPTIIWWKLLNAGIYGGEKRLKGKKGRFLARSKMLLLPYVPISNG